MRQLVRSGQVVRWHGKNVVLAFPFELGGPLPQLGPDQFYLTDDNDIPLIDDDGNLLIEEWSYSNG